MINWANGQRNAGWEFNSGECAVLQFSRTNQGTTCTVNGRILRSVKEQQDGVVQVNSSMKVVVQAYRVVKATSVTLV